MAESLKLSKLAEDHRPAERDGRCGGIKTEFDVQRHSLPQAARPILLRWNDLVYAVEQNLELFYRRHERQVSEKHRAASIKPNRLAELDRPLLAARSSPLSGRS